MNQQESYYDVLGLPVQADLDQIRGRYHELVRRHHPDVANGHGQDAFRRIADAYRVLQDPQQRVQYDRSLQGRREATAPMRMSDRTPRPPAAVLRSPAMQRLLSEAEGDAHAEAGQHAEALASYREALGRTPNPALEAKIARLEAGLGGTGGGAGPSAPPRQDTPAEREAQPFWRRWFGRD